jgi:hypothetical protein
LTASLTETEKNFPKKAVDFLITHPEKGNLFNKYCWGGYLIWRGRKVFIDGRLDVYGEEFMREYIQVEKGKKNWKKILEKYKIKVILWPRGGFLPTLLKESSEWQIIYEDEIAIIFQKNLTKGKKYGIMSLERKILSLRKGKPPQKSGAQNQESA